MSTDRDNEIPDAKASPNPEAPAVVPGVVDREGREEDVFRAIFISWNGATPEELRDRGELVDARVSAAKKTTSAVFEALSVSGEDK